MIKFPLVRILFVGVAIGAVATATVIAADRSGGTTPIAQVAATNPATAARNTNVGGDTHGNSGGNGTFNGNDQGTGGPTTPGLTALFKGITVKARSVSAVVHAPAGLAVTNTTEVLTINLTEQVPGGAVPYHWNRLAVLEPQFEVTVSDLAFTLLNDCDVVGDSDISLYYGDDRGVVETDLSMSANQTRRIHAFSRHLPAATVSNRLIAPFVVFIEEDVTGFHGHPADPTGPALLPGTTKHYSYDLADERRQPCNAHADYIVAIKLLTFTSL
jgi:hypothetical protein